MGAPIVSRRMEPDEIRAFLLYGTRTAKIATVRRDGRPHLSPVWFTLDGDDIVFASAADTVKARTLRRDPRVSVCVDLEEPPFGFVVVDGTATLVDDAAVADEWLRRIALRYEPAPAAPAARAPDRYNRLVGTLVRVTPAHVLAISYDS